MYAFARNLPFVVGFAVGVGGVGPATEAPAPAHSAPSRGEVAAWLGSWAAGPEVVTFRWHDGLILDLDRIRVPVDGRWHETVATFAVRHRAGWLAERGRVSLEEQHDEGAHWRYLLAPSADGSSLLKTAPPARPGGEAKLVRTYRRRAETAPESR